MPLLVGIAGGCVLVTTVILLVMAYRRQTRRTGRQDWLDKEPSQLRVDPTTGFTPQEQQLVREPTIEHDGVRAVLEHNRVKPLSHHDVSYGNELGRGVFGVVLKAKAWHIDCAVKQLSHSVKHSVQMLQSLLDEYDAMSLLRHPNVLLSMGIVLDANDTVGVVMELMQASLHDVIYEPSFRPYATWDGALICIASDVAKGMSFIHQQGMLHRDLKPCNVLIDAQWVSKVADVGMVIDGSLHGADGEIRGAPPYMAPEIVALPSGRACTSANSKPVDVWAFGCILAHMATRQFPYQQLQCKTRVEMLDAIRAGASPLELLLTSDAPQSIVHLAQHCCEREPAGRPDFEAVASLLFQMEGAQRPLARVHGKKVDPMRQPFAGTALPAAALLPPFEKTSSRRTAQATRRRAATRARRRWASRWSGCERPFQPCQSAAGGRVAPSAHRSWIASRRPSQVASSSLSQPSQRPTTTTLKTARRLST